MSIPKNSFRHLTDKDRTIIATLRHAKYSINAIAKRLSVHRSTVYREIQRNGGKHVYNEVIAHRQARKRWDKSHKKLSIPSHTIRTYIVFHLIFDGWSPEQIAGRLSIDMPQYTISHETIYHFIYRFAPHLTQYLRKQHQTRKKRRVSRSFSVSRIPHRVSVHERGDVSNEYGHWEVDLVGSSSKATVLALVEKHTRYVLFHKIPDKTAHTVQYGMLFALRNIPRHLCNSFTYDNGSEFMLHTEINTRLNARSYFCTPYCAWEKGLVEHSIGLLRQYFPKKTLFHRVKQSDILQVQTLINHRPRKCLHFLTSAEAFSVAFSP